MHKQTFVPRKGWDFASHDALTAAVGMSAADRDRDGSFPASAFDALRGFGLIAHPPLSGCEAAKLFQILASVGRGDLSVGRIFEGHINALFLIQHFGTVGQRQRYAALASMGKLFGVWNTDRPGDALTLEGTRLRGKKTFASGVDGLSHAIVTASEPCGRVMIVVPVAGLPVDRSWWRPLGMRASGSHIVDLTNVTIEPEWILGGHDDYIKEPWFSGGAVRFAAVQVGGMHAVLDAAVTHLRRTKRTGDPYQKHHIGRIGIAVESGYAWLGRAAQFWLEATAAGANPRIDAGIVSIANATRLGVESCALAVLEEAERCVGAAGLMAPHPLERLVRDLRTYLRQPNPDGALAALGSVISDGLWSPGRAFLGE
jgi:alkylation response protein AidB-like acyl-CoA dehydrogenase